MTRNAAVEPDRPSLLDPTAVDLRRDREAERDEPRPGIWSGDDDGDDDSDARMLTQDDTDMLIRTELLSVAPHAERAELVRAFGDPSRCGRITSAPDASVQRGGLDSDPLVRVLARRAWGDRDRRWFAERGVRTGDMLALVDLPHGAWGVATAWAHDLAFATARFDARPGEPVLCKLMDRPPAGDVGFVVRDRVRIDPSTAPALLRRALEVRPGRRIAASSWKLVERIAAIKQARAAHVIHERWIDAELARGVAAVEVAGGLMQRTTIAPAYAAQLITVRVDARAPDPCERSATRDDWFAAAVIGALAREACGQMRVRAARVPPSWNVAREAMLIDDVTLQQALARLGEPRCGTIYNAACCGNLRSR